MAEVTQWPQAAVWAGEKDKPRLGAGTWCQQAGVVWEAIVHGVAKSQILSD